MQKKSVKTIVRVIAVILVALMVLGCVSIVIPFLFG